jgi:hypothetical protein
MDDVRDRLKRASELVAPFERSFDRMIERRDRKRRSQRLASAAVAFAIAATAVGGGTVLLSRLGQGPLDSPGAGWQSTRRLELQPGEYFYLRVESSDLGDGHVRDEETWWALDGSGEVRNHSTRQGKYPYPPDGTYGEGDFPIWIPNVSDLSTDPVILAAQLREDPWNWGEPAEPKQLWGVIRSLLFESPYAAPELRAAVFEVTTGIDGVVVEESERDPAGRPAVRVRFSRASEGMWDLYFDPGTHQALAWTFNSTRGGYVWELVESGIVDAAGARPEADQWLVPPLPS